MKRKVIILLAVLLTFLALFSACDTNMRITYIGIENFSGHISTKGYSAYIYQVVDASNDVYYVLDSSKRDIGSEISFSIQGASINGIVAKVVDDFMIQKKDKGETVIVSYYPSYYNTWAFKSKEDAEKNVKNDKKTIEISKENIVFFYG